MPIVATVRIRRGELWNRRTSPTSTAPPRRAAPISTTGIAARYGQPRFAMSRSAMTAGTEPSCAWAKLMMRFAR